MFPLVRLCGPARAPFCIARSQKSPGRSHVSSGRERRLCPLFFFAGHQRHLHRRYLCPLRKRSLLRRSRVAGVFQKPEGYAGRRAQERAGAVLGTQQLALDATRRTDFRARRQLGRGRKGCWHQACGQGAGQGRGTYRGRRSPGHPRLRARPDADPRLPHARPFSRQARSTRHRGATRPRGAGSAILRLHRGRLRSKDLPRSRAWPRIRHLARNRRDLRAHLLPDARRRIHAYLQCRPEILDTGADRGAGQGNLVHPRGPSRDPQQADRSRRLREIL